MFFAFYEWAKKGYQPLMTQFVYSFLVHLGKKGYEPLSCQKVGPLDHKVYSSPPTVQTTFK